MGKLFKFTITFLTLIIMLSMLGVLFLAFSPVNLPPIEGKKEIEEGTKITQVRNLSNELEFALKSEQKLSLSERDINLFLAKTIKGEQKGIGKENIQFKRAWVNLVPNTIQLFLEREVTYLPESEGQEKESMNHVMQLDIQIRSLKDDSRAVTRTIEFKTGKIGQMPVRGQFIQLVKMPFDNLATIFTKEIKMFLEMEEVHIFDGSIDLHPKVKTEVKVKF